MGLNNFNGGGWDRNNPIINNVFFRNDTYALIAPGAPRFITLDDDTTYITLDDDTTFITTDN